MKRPRFWGNQQEEEPGWTIGTVICIVVLGGFIAYDTAKRWASNFYWRLLTE